MTLGVTKSQTKRRFFFFFLSPQHHTLHICECHVSIDIILVKVRTEIGASPQGYRIGRSAEVAPDSSSDGARHYVTISRTFEDRGGTLVYL